MSTHPHPKISRAPSFPLIWVVPIVAVLIGAYMGFEELHSRGPTITIEFADGSGVEAGRTILEYKGVNAGTVRSVDLTPDLKTVIVKIRLKKEAQDLAVQGSKFWILHPEIGLGGIHGLDTLVTGVRLNVRPGTGPAAKEFRGLDQTPPPEAATGRTFMLVSDKLGSLATGSPVLYRQLKVGEVEASRLSDDSRSVIIRIHIDPIYSDLVRKDTKFWNAGGLSFKVGLLGASLKESSLESLISGGVAFATPTDEHGQVAPPAEEGTVFNLAPDADKDWLRWSPSIPIEAQEVAPASSPEKALLPSILKH